MLITNIQRFSLNDGPGIRTTIFLKGCNLNCQWCANPENISFEKEKYIKNNIEGIYGKNVTLNELEKEILKDKIYYETGGGVTFSGGEPLLHINELEPLLKRLKKQKINMCIETALMVSQENIKVVLQYIDTFIIDIKILDTNNCKKIIGGDINLYMKNIQTIFEQTQQVIFRIPLIKPYTYNKQNLCKIYEFLDKYKPLKVEIFKTHNLAKSKYESLNKKMIKIEEEISKAEIKTNIAKFNINVEICTF